MPKPDPARLRRCGTCAIVFDDQRRILLHRRADNGQWGLPGGSVEVGETAADTIIREVREETGYLVEIVRLIGIYSDPKTTTITYPNGDVVSYVALSFQCRVTGGVPTLSDETTEVRWADPRNLPEPFLNNHRPRVADALLDQVQAFYR